MSLTIPQNGKENLKPSSEQLCIDEGGQRRMVRLVWADRKVMLTQIVTLYNCGEQRSIRMNNNLEPRQVPLLSARNRNVRLQWHRLTNTGQLKTETWSLVWWMWISAEAAGVESFGVYSMNPCSPPVYNTLMLPHLQSILVSIVSDHILTFIAKVYHLLMATSCRTMLSSVNVIKVLG